MLVPCTQHKHVLPWLVIYSEYCAEQVNALNNYGKSFTNPFSETNNPNWKNHSTISHGDKIIPLSNVHGQPLQSQNQFPPSFHPPNQSYEAQNYFNQPQAPQSNYFQSVVSCPTATTVIFRGHS